MGYRIGQLISGDGDYVKINCLDLGFGVVDLGARGWIG